MSATVATLTRRYGTDPAHLYAAIAPCIGVASYEVGDEVVARFTEAGFDDTSIMLSEEDYTDLFKELDEKLGDEFGGMVYHSCGIWEKKIHMVQTYRNIRCADGAFTIETDPSPNKPEVFGDAFNGTGIILNARAVGNAQNSFEAFRKLWRPNQRLICVTYCKTPQEQEILYNRLHEMEAGTK